MFVPISDDNALKSISFQYVTIALIAINVAVFLFTAAGVDPGFIASFAVVPAELLGIAAVGLGNVATPGDLVAVPESMTLVSYMFFHADLFHLAGNMLFLWVFGDNVEDAMGHFRFLVFYILCGVFAALTHSFIVANAAASASVSVPLIGASGAVAGVIAAYLMLHPRVRVWVLAMKVFPLQVSAMLALGAWILIQIIMVLMPQTGPVAWWAHIGGLIAGAVLIVFMRKPGVPLFDRGLPSSA